MDVQPHLSFLSLSSLFSLRLYLYLIIVFIGQKLTQDCTVIDMYSVNFQESLYRPVRTLYPESPSYIEEPFPDWLEEKIELPIFDDLPPPPICCLEVGGVKACPSHESDAVTLKAPTSLINGPGCRVPPHSSLVGHSPYHQAPVLPPPAPIPADQTYMQELDYGLAGVGGGAHDTLTPPDSPRDGDLLVFTMLQEMQPHELDELVRMRADSLVEEGPEASSAYEEGPEASSNSSAYEESDSAASPCSSVEPDWTPTGPFTARRRRAAKPYTRGPPEDRKQRKKEQNKNAATRYRQKKKQEVEEIMGEEKELRQKNENLKQELTELARETKYLKNLMRELFKAKGLIK